MAWIHITIAAVSGVKLEPTYRQFQEGELIIYHALVGKANDYPLYNKENLDLGWNFRGRIVCHNTPVITK